jgi:hypothetical protein
LSEGAGIAQSVQRLRCGLDDRGVGVQVLVGARGFLFCIRPRPALGPTQPPKTDHSPPFSTYVKNGGSIPPLPHTASWLGALLPYLKHRDTFTHFNMACLAGAVISVDTFCSECYGKKGEDVGI